MLAVRGPLIAIGAGQYVERGFRPLAGLRDLLTFALTGETSYLRGDEAVSREDVAAGERAVVMYVKKDDVNTAIEVKLAPKSE